MIHNLNSTKEPTEVFLVTKAALQSIGNLRMEDTSSLRLHGTFRYVLQKVNIFVNLLPTDLGTIICIETISDDVWEKGARKALEKLIPEIERNLMLIRNKPIGIPNKSEDSQNEIDQDKIVPNDIGNKDITITSPSIVMKNKTIPIICVLILVVYIGSMFRDAKKNEELNMIPNNKTLGRSEVESHNTLSNNNINQSNKVCSWCSKPFEGTHYTHLGRISDCRSTNDINSIGKYCSTKCCAESRKSSCPTCH